MDVALIDPSAFTPPYDHHLASGIAENGCNVRLLTTDAEYYAWNEKTGYAIDTLFYNATNCLYEQTTDAWHRSLFKGFEHGLDMIRLLRYLRAWNPDVIHFQWLPLALYDIQLLEKFRSIAPIVFTIHDSNPFHGAVAFDLQLHGARQAPKRFDHVIAHTEYSKKRVCSMGVSSSDVSVIPHGILEYPYEPELGDTELEDNQLLFFGSIKEYKGIDVLLDAFAALPDSVQARTTLTIVGSPKIDTGSLREQAQRLGIESSVEWDLRYVPDEEIPTLFERADVVAFPYREIDQSGALLTALDYHKPIVATNVGGFSEVLEDGVHALLTDPESPDAFATQLEKVLTDEELASKLSSNTRELAENTLSWERIGDQTRQVYKQLISSHG